VETWQAYILAFAIITSLQLLLRAIPLPNKLNTWVLARRMLRHERRMRINEYLAKVSTRVERDCRRPIGFRVGKEE